jgi:hypothetical protein
MNSVAPFLFAGLLTALITGHLPSQEKKSREFICKKTKLILDLSLLPELDAGETSERTTGFWYGEVDGCTWDIALITYPHDSYRLREPGMAMSFIDDWYAEKESKKKGQGVLGARTVLQNKCGYAPYSCIASGELKKKKAWLHIMTGVTEDYAYGIEIELSGTNIEAARKQAEAFFRKGVRYVGEQWDPRWSDEEIDARWKRDVPDKLREEKFKIRRTDHFLVMSNSSTGLTFAREMEKCYKKIKKVFPFEENKGMRLMPVFVFRMPEEYYEYYAKICNTSIARARRSKGHAWRDYYATWYESPKDPVHIHEAVHQIFKNRLFLSGGGSWFQEGVADYISEQKNEVKAVARRASRDGKMPNLRIFMQIPSLIGTSSANRNYILSASLITCIGESKWGKKKFMDFVHAVGSCPRNDIESIEDAIKQVYGISIDELQKRWAKHFK